MAGGSLADGSRTQELTALVEHALFDDLVRSHQQRLRNREAERLRGLEVDDQLVLTWCFHWKSRRAGTAQDLIDVDGGATELFAEARRVRHEPTGLGELPCRAHGREPVLPRQLSNALPLREEER